MAGKTQHRPHGALTGRRFGSFVGKPAGPVSSHPVGVLTQGRPLGALTARRFGPFAGKTAGGAGAPFEIDAPMNAALSGTLTPAGSLALGIGLSGSVALTGTLSVAGDLQITDPGGTPFDLAPTAAAALSGTLTPAGALGLGIGVGGNATLAGTFSATGAFSYGVGITPTGVVALAGTLSVTGDVSYSDEPIVEVSVGHGAVGRARAPEVPAFLDLADWGPNPELERHQMRLQNERNIVAILTALAAAEIL